MWIKLSTDVLTRIRTDFRINTQTVTVISPHYFRYLDPAIPRIQTKIMFWRIIQKRDKKSYWTCCAYAISSMRWRFSSHPWHSVAPGIANNIARFNVKDLSIHQPIIRPHNSINRHAAHDAHDTERGGASHTRGQNQVLLI